MDKNHDSQKKLPKLVVFDLDFTLWPFWVDTHVTPPFKKSNDKVIDSIGQKVKFYPEVPQILQTLKEMNIPVGIASRTSEIKGANQLCQIFDWDKYFKYKQIYPGNKVAHFNEFKKLSGIEFIDMIFFDDEDRNIRDISKLKVTCILVKNGMSMEILNKGLAKFSQQKQEHKINIL